MKKLIYLVLLTFSILSCSDSVNDDEKLNDFTKDSGTFIDERDGHQYKWVKIGDQIWMAENLAYLPFITSPTISSNSKAYCYVYDYFGNSVLDAKSTEKYKTYGVLYNWVAAMNFCPKGWHLPSDDEMRHLGEIVLPDAPLNPTNYEYLSISKVLKSKTGWYLNGSGTDDYGFTLLPGGCCYPGDFGNVSPFYSIENKAYLWTSTIDEKYDRALPWEFFALLPNAEIFFEPKNAAFSVRCVKD